MKRDIVRDYGTFEGHTLMLKAIPHYLKGGWLRKATGKGVLDETRYLVACRYSLQSKWLAKRLRMRSWPVRFLAS